VTTLYDVCADSSAVSGDVRSAIVGLVVGLLLLIPVWRRKDAAPRRLVLGFLAVWLAVSGWNAYGDTKAQRGACAALASGRASVVEGPVTDFSAFPLDGRGFETFRVGGVFFRIGPGHGSGLTRVAANGGPIRSGRTLRLTHSGETILKVEEPAR
jgi:hypothetical protein